MAPKVCVPMDFGRHLLGSPTHNNLKLNTSDCGEVLASSVILSFNSPVIDHMTTTLHMTSVDLLEFSEAGVQLFVDSAYSGTAEGITRGLFRDVNKIANVFEVTWLIGECSKYFNKVADSIKTANYPELLFLFEEAAFIFEHLKKEEFLEVAIKNIEKFRWKQQFIDNYLNNADRLSTQKLDLVIELAGSEVELVVQKLTKQLSELVLENGLPDYSRYLLDNCDLSMCKKSNNILFDDLFAVLDNLPDNELRWMYTLIRKSTTSTSAKASTKECKSSNSKSLHHMVKEKSAALNASGAKTKPSKATSIIHIKNVTCRTKLQCLDDFFKWLHESEEVCSIIMALEIVSHWNNYCEAAYQGEKSIKKESVERYYNQFSLKLRLENLRRSRGWLGLPSTLVGYRIKVYEHTDLDISFLCCLADVSPGFDSNVVARCNLSTGTFTFNRSTGSENTFKFLNIYEFCFRHPSITSCNLPGRCGFFLQTGEIAESMGLMLCTDQKKYYTKKSTHFHPEVRAENFMHVFYTYRTKGSNLDYIGPWFEFNEFKEDKCERRPAVLYRV